MNDNKSVIEKALAYAKQKGATQAQASLSTESGLSVAVRMQATDTIEFNQGKSFSVTVYFGHQKGSAQSSDTSKKAIETAIDAACRIASYSQSDVCQGLPDANGLETNLRDCNRYHPWEIEPENAIALAKECEQAGLKFDPKIQNSDGTSLCTHQSETTFGNTHGFLHTFKSTQHSLDCCLIAKNANGMQRDYDYTVALDHNKLGLPKKIGQSAAKRAIAKLNPKTLSTRKSPIIFESNIASGLFSSLIAAVSGGNQYRKTTFLHDALSKQILPDWINLKEDPYNLNALGSAPCDAEGVKCDLSPIVEKGQLKRYCLSSYSARKLGLASTGNAGGVRNLNVTTQDLNLEALLKQMGTGFLVTELIGHGINLTTGDYSKGASGFWVENGEIAYPVEECTIAGNLKDIFLGIESISNDVDARHNILTGSILINQMMIAGE